MANIRQLHNKNAIVNHLKVDIAASTELVAAVAGNKIVVLDFFLVAAGAVTAKFQSVVADPSSTTDLTGAMSMITGVPFPASDPEYGVLEGVEGGNLKLTLGSGVQVSGCLSYILIAN